MRGKLWIFAAVVLLAGGWALLGCKKSAPPPRLDPHSSEGLLKAITDHGDLLREGVRAKDWNYVDDRAFNLQGLAKALLNTLEPERKQRLTPLFNEVIRVAEELDHAAGRRHEAASIASFEKLDSLLKQLQAQFASAPKTSG